MKPIPLSHSRSTTFAKVALAIMLVAALVGLVDSVLIHLKEIAAKTDSTAFVSCSTDGVINCAKVAESKYSQFLGLPVSLLGVFFYEAMALLAFVLLLGFTLPNWLRLAIHAVVIGSFLFSLRLLYYSYFGLGYLCPYCLVSNLTTLLVTVFWFSYSAKQPRLS